MNEDFLRQCREKELTPDEAAALVQSGQKIYIGCCTSYSRSIADAIARRSEELENVTIGCSNIIPPMSFLDCKNPKAFRISTFFMGYEERRAMSMGMADFTAFHLGQVDQWCLEIFRPDIAFLDVSYPDENGYMSFGLSGCCMHTYILQSAKRVILQINRSSPYAHGIDNLIHISQAEHVVFVDDAKETIPGGLMEENDPDILSMSSFLVDQVPDGACIQIGIGGVSGAVGFGLMKKNDLGCHTELMTNSLMALMKAGVINNSRRKFIPGRSVAGFAFGTKELYDFIDHNEQMCFGPFPIVNNPANIAQNDNMISINTAMSIDLLGQVSAESIGPRQFSGIGGQGDYIRGAQMAKGGKSFIALKSTLGTNPDGSPKSRIVPTFSPFTTVTTTRADVQYVVTEYGAVNLKTLTMRDRVRALISIAHPDCRNDLTRDAKKAGIL